MADHSDVSFKAGEAKGHAQVKKDEVANKASDAAQSCKASCQESKEQAGGFMQETGEHMKNMAQGAADTVKNAVGKSDGSAGGRTTTTTTSSTAGSR